MPERRHLPDTVRLLTQLRTTQGPFLPLGSELAAQSAQATHMAAYLTSTQQRRAARSPQRRQRMAALPLLSPDGGYEALDDRAGCPRPKDARPVVSETKALIIAVMSEFDRPMTSAELYAIWDGTKPLQAIEYHLSTLVKTGVAEMVYGPELHFSLTVQAEK